MASLTQLLEDGERLAANLLPTPQELQKVLGALVLHVEQLAGRELGNLADEVLGITPAQGPVVQGSSEGVSSVTVAQQSADERIASLEAENAALRTQVQTPPAGAPGSGVTETGAAKEPA